MLSARFLLTSAFSLTLALTIPSWEGVSHRELAERANDGPYWCGCDFKKNDADLKAAAADLEAQAGAAGRLKENYYSIHGGVVAFACVESPRYDEGPITSNAAVDALAKVRAQCAVDIAGTYQWTNPSYDSPYWVGAMQYTDGRDFCHNARISQTTGCV